MRVKRSTLALLAVAILLAGCTQGPGASSGSKSGTSSRPVAVTPLPDSPTFEDAEWLDVDCKLPPALGTPTPLPDILAIESRGALTRYAWNSNGTLGPVATATPGARMLAVVGATIVTADKDVNGWHLTARGGDLKEQHQIDVPQVTAMTGDGARLYVVTQWNLTVYDATLRSLGRVDLQVPEVGKLSKAVHAIRIADGHAHLLDAAQSAPFHVFRVDVRDPAAMNVTLTYPASASQTPHLQWLDLATSTWYVEQNHLSLGVTSRAVVPLDIANGTAGREMSIQTGSFAIRAGEEPRGNTTGHDITSTTFTLPAWIINVDNGLALSQLEIRGRTLARSCTTPIAGDVQVLQHEDLLVTHGRSHVSVWEVRGSVRPRASAQLPVPPQSLVLYPVPT